VFFGFSVQTRHKIANQEEHPAYKSRLKYEIKYDTF